MSEFTQNAQNAQNEEQKQVNLLDIEIKNENDALNAMVGFLGLAQKRGVYAINESAKIYECIKVFQKPQPNAPPTSPPTTAQ
jgi:hypothetical protein